MITVELQGGLGNQLFQLAFLDYMSEKTGKLAYINSLESPITVHSNEQYYYTLFKNWKCLYRKEHAEIIQENNKMRFQEFKIPSANVSFLGYFQRWEYVHPIKESFIKKLSFNTAILQKYPNISKKVFIHIRGGDYKGNSFHQVNLTSYYKRCIALFPESEFVVFTNDIPYAKTFGDFPIITENEVDTLFLMSKCAGCICANSSFSWWGAYLNQNRKICLPSKWFLCETMDISGYHFNNSIIVSTNV